MCLSKVYVYKNGEKRLIMEEVSLLEIKDDKLLLKNLFGEQKEIVADVREVDFMTHSIVLENLRG